MKIIGCKSKWFDLRVTTEYRVLYFIIIWWNGKNTLEYFKILDQSDAEHGPPNPHTIQHSHVFYYYHTIVLLSCHYCLRQTPLKVEKRSPSGSDYSIISANYTWCRIISYEVSFTVNSWIGDNISQRIYEFYWIIEADLATIEIIIN